MRLILAIHSRFNGSRLAMAYFSGELRECFRASRDVLARLNGFT